MKTFWFKKPDPPVRVGSAFETLAKPSSWMVTATLTQETSYGILTRQLIFTLTGEHESDVLTHARSHIAESHPAFTIAKLDAYRDPSR